MGNASNKVSKEIIVAKSSSLFNSQDVKVVKDILGKGHSEYTARRILEDAEKKQLKKAKHQDDSTNWIHRDWRVKAGLKIEEVEQEQKFQKEQDKKLFIPEKAVETSPQPEASVTAAVEPSSSTEEASVKAAVEPSSTEEASAKAAVEPSSTEEASVKAAVEPSSSTEEASAKAVSVVETSPDKVESKVEICIVEGENESTVLYITQPTASMFKGISKYGNSSQSGSYHGGSLVSDSSEELSEDYEMDGGGFMRIANEDD